LGIEELRAHEVSGVAKGRHVQSHHVICWCPCSHE